MELAGNLHFRPEFTIEFIKSTQVWLHYCDVVSLVSGY